MTRRHNQFSCEEKKRSEKKFAAVFNTLTIFIRYSSCQYFFSLHVTAIVLKTTCPEAPELSSQIPPFRFFSYVQGSHHIDTSDHNTVFSTLLVFFSSTYQDKVSIFSVLLTSSEKNRQCFILTQDGFTLNRVLIATFPLRLTVLAMRFTVHMVQSTLS